MKTLHDYTQLDFIECPAFVLDVQPDGVPVYAAHNTFASNLMGKPSDFFIGKTAQDAFSGVAGVSAFKRHLHVIETGQRLPYELALVLEGRERQFKMTLVPVLNADHEVVQIYGSGFEVTEQGDAAKERVDHDTLYAEIEQFISLAAHDLRAPMRNVSMIADMLREDFQDQGDGKMELIDMLERLAHRSMALISDVLAHANSTGLRPSSSTFKLGDLCQNIVNVLDPIGRNQYLFENCELTSDRMVMQVALRNIIENAIKHSGRKHLRMHIKVAQQSDGILVVTLRDNGVGFSEAALSFLGGGILRVESGYGLFGVRRLIEARNGAVTAHNDPATGGGVVTFTLNGTRNRSLPTMGDIQLKSGMKPMRYSGQGSGLPLPN